jgi:hypothetical protein
MQPSKPSVFMTNAGYDKVVSHYRYSVHNAAYADMTEHTYTHYGVDDQLQVLYGFITPTSQSQFAASLRLLAPFPPYNEAYTPSMANIGKHVSPQFTEYCKRFKQAYLQLDKDVDDEHRLPYQQAGNANSLQEIFFSAVPGDFARTLWQLRVPESKKRQLRDILGLIDLVMAAFYKLCDLARKHKEEDELLLQKQPRYRKDHDVRYIDDGSDAREPTAITKLLVRGTTTHYGDMHVNALTGGRDKYGGRGDDREALRGCFRMILQPPYECTQDRDGKCNYLHDQKAACATWARQYKQLEASPFAPDSFNMAQLPTKFTLGEYQPRGPIKPHNGLLLSKEGRPADRRDKNPSAELSYLHSMPSDLRGAESKRHVAFEHECGEESDDGDN